jgi:geranylgeranyl diphosphate synthase type I
MQMSATIESFGDCDGRAAEPGTRTVAPAARGSEERAAERVAFHDYATRLRPRVEAALDTWLTAKMAERADLPLSARAPVEAACELARRRGKRLRAVLVGVAYEAFGGGGGADAVVLAGVSLELLQAYLLIHDDWMDGDDARRGGPSVPAMMRRRFGPGVLADASAILAGDFAASLALDALLSVPCPAERLVLAARELAWVEEDVVQGQLLDMLTSASESSAQVSVETTHRLKTASYTVRGPVCIGARLAGAGDDACRALAAYAEPLGVAFQLRDDLLGTFGDPAATGKPRFSDLQSGKRTGLIAEAERAPGAPDRLRFLGDPAARSEDLETLACYLDASGARARVEARIDALLAESRTRLADSPAAGAGRLALLGAIDALGRREA